MMLVVGLCATASASIRPSTVEAPVWYQLKSGNNYLGWQNYGAIYAMLDGMNPGSVNNPDMLFWAFIPADEGYKLLNKANHLYLGVVDNYVNLSDEGIVWTVTETDEMLTLSCDAGELYNDYFIQVGNRTPISFTPIEENDSPIAFLTIVEASTVAAPVWYQLKSGENYLGWTESDAVYAKLEGMKPGSVSNPDKLSWAFISTDDGYKLLNKANGLYLDVIDNIVCLTVEGRVWTVTETDNCLTLSCSDGELYDDGLVKVGGNSPVSFTPVKPDDNPFIPVSVIKPSTVETPIWYQLRSGDDYLGWYDWGAIYTKLEGITPTSIDDADKLSWAFISIDDGYKLLNKANGQFMGVRDGYVNLSEEGVVWTVTQYEDEGYITFTYGDDALYSSYFVQVGNHEPVHFTLIEMGSSIPTALNAVSYSPIDEVYDMQGRRIGSQVKNLPAGIYMVNGRKVVVR